MDNFYFLNYWYFLGLYEKIIKISDALSVKG